MTNNDILRRVRYAFDFNDSKMMALFEMGGKKVSRKQISAWLKKDDDPAWVACSEQMLATFLNGLIRDRRGEQEGVKPNSSLSLNNNIIFRKLRIALNLKDDGVLALLKLAGFPLSKAELSALFRKPGSRQFRVCKDQILRNFIKGVQLKYRSEKPAPVSGATVAPKWPHTVNKQQNIEDSPS